MKYWWVNHKQTSREELQGGYIWSPKKNKGDSFNQTYKNLTIADVGDKIISYSDAKIKAIGIIKEKYAETDRPFISFKQSTQWDKHGWMVKVDWHLLEVPLSPKQHIAAIKNLLPDKYSPIRENGIGNQGCYLAEIDKNLWTALVKLLSERNLKSLTSFHEDDNTIIGDKQEEAINNSELEITEKEQLVKSRRGQGKFRDRLERIESKCRVTGVKDKRFLIASHIKPWSESNNTEKLDGNNGLLLSPHIDKLFDNGWITFSENGNINYYDDAVKELLVVWGVDIHKSVSAFNKRQLEYLEYHKDNIFGKFAK